MSDKQHIFIGIPTTRLSVTNEIADFCEASQLLAYHPNSPWRFTVRRINGNSGVEYARNRLVGEFLKSDADALWFVDQDVRPSRNSLELLLLLDRFDIVAGIYPAFQHFSGRPPTLTFGVYHEEGDGWRCDPIPEGGNPIIECDAVMMGATLIKRTVLEDSRLLLGPMTEKAPPIFRTPRLANGGPISTEDTDFCKRVRALGYKVGCHTDVKWGHLKEIDLLTVAQMLIDAYVRGMCAEQDRPKIELVS